MFLLKGHFLANAKLINISKHNVLKLIFKVLQRYL